MALVEIYLVLFFKLRKMLKTIFLITFIFFSRFCFSQNISQINELAQKAMLEQDFITAIKFYELILQNQPDNIEAMYMLAEANRNSSNYQNASLLYLKVFEVKPELFPLSLFYAAKMLKSNEEYEKAKKYFIMFYEKNIETDKEIIKTFDLVNQINSCDSAIIWKSQPHDLKIVNLKNINTEFNEFGAVPLRDSVLFFSSIRPRFETQNPMLLAENFVTNIYISKFGNLGLRKPKLFDRTINSRRYNASNISFNIDLSKVYFTRCINQGNRQVCQLYISIKAKNDKWKKPQKLPYPINIEKYTTSHPYVSFDSISGNQIIFFSSDRPGGFGGMDIWFSIISNGLPQAPINLGSIINTSGNEITPFYQIETNTLFFSSDKHIGMGGFDVFKSYGALNSWTVPKNLEFPINSGANDYYYVIANEQEAYLTSNRKGSLTFGNLTCCNDIYLIRKDVINLETKTEIATKIGTSIKDDILELLPLSLYFDNDHPNPRSISPTTWLTYSQTLATYLERRNEFAIGFSSGLSLNERKLAKESVESFFDNDVKINYKKLEAITQLTYQTLLEGSNITFKVRGFASPLTSADYNYFLTKRRINSLKNYFRQWDSGALVEFMEPDSNNKVRFNIVEEAIGEATAPQIVSDNPQDRRLSVYSPAASKERRIELVNFEIFLNESKSEDAKLFVEDNLIKLINSQLDAGKIEIIVYNIGKTPLLIKDIKVSSEKIQVIAKSNIIASGESGKIEIKLDIEKRIRFFEHIKIKSNSVEQVNYIFLTNE